MDIWIYNDDFERLDIVDSASSLIWTQRYRQAGDFEIYIPATAALLDLLQEDRLVGLADGKDTMLCIIEKVHISNEEEAGDYLTVTGRSIESILERRIVWDQTALTGTVENIMRQLITDAFISPAIAERKYDKLKLAAAHGFTETASVQYTGDNLKEVIETLCAQYNYGYKITLQAGSLVLDFYRGLDRSTSQVKNPRVVFADEFDNLTASTYTKDTTAYRSVALVAGEGEGSARRRVTVSRTIDTSGLYRREIFIDARDLSSNDGEISDADYTAQLSERGSSALSEAAYVESMTGTMETRVQYEYGTDYNLGDLTTIINKYGVQADSQVLEVVQVWDENGHTCTPTFG